MPDKLQILSGLAGVVNGHTGAAVAWHVIIFLVIVFLLAKKMPARLMVWLLGLSMASVGIFALMSKNPFDGIVFIILFVAFTYFGTKATGAAPETSAILFRIAGLLVIGFGLVYPHFLETGSWAKYLIAAPFGLIPCPTLSVATGFLILHRGYRSKGLMITTILAGALYGLFGVFRLGVLLDVGLLAGTAVLFMFFLTTRRRLSAIGVQDKLREKDRDWDGAAAVRNERDRRHKGV